MKIIAELGTLHHHDLKSLETAIEDCLLAGADLVKIQLINSRTAWWANPEQKARYKALDKPLEVWLEFFAKINSKYNNPLFASIFDEEYLGIAPVSPIIKLGYKAQQAPNLLYKTAILEGKNIFISVNSAEEINNISKLLHTKNLNITYFYTQPIYPVPLDNILIPLNTSLFKGYSFNGQFNPTLIQTLNLISYKTYL